MRIQQVDITEVFFQTKDYTQGMYDSIVRIGLSFPVKVSLEQGKFYCQDGHKRLSAIMDMKEAIENNDYQGVVNCLGNTLEEPSLKIVPDILKIKEEMKELGFDGALMSGSGSCVFGLTQDQELLEKGYQFFLNRYAFVRKTEILNKDSLKL